MVFRPNIDPKLAFVLIPFKPPFDTYYDSILKLAAKSVGLDTRKADEIYSTSPIIQDIWRQIWASTVVIADVTGKNPNVNYELGICHTLGVPTVIITQNIDDVPFDYKHRRCIVYNTEDVDWQRKLKKSITETLKQVIAGEDLQPELGWPYDTSPIPKETAIGTLVPADNARDVVIRGVRIVRDAVAYAFGPHGMHVSAIAGQDEHKYYKQGTAIADSIRSSEHLEATGINHARQLASEMRNGVGDGSKTAVLLFYIMVNSGSEALKRGYPPSDVMRGIERAVETVVSAIKSESRSVTADSLLDVARTATAGDHTIAGTVIEAYRKAGKDGLIVIEQGTSRETTLEVQEGMYFDRGYVDPAFVRSAEAHESVLEDTFILIYDSKISSMRDLLPLLEQVAKVGKPLLVIADDIEGEALATLIVNRQKGTLNCLAVKAPGYADRRRALLQDIAVLTGGRVIALSLGQRLDNVTLGDLGQARKVIVTKQSTTILGGAGESHLGKHVETIRAELERTKDPFMIEKLRERLAKLGGAIASIRIGGISNREISDKTYSAESAMHSVQKAIEEGFVVGGGVTLLQAKQALTKLSFKKPGEVAGVNIVTEAMEGPIRQLVLNNGNAPTEVFKRIKRAKASGAGFNVETGKVQDLVNFGILDPVSTVTHAIQLAFSHARIILETGAWGSAVPESQNLLVESLPVVPNEP